MKKITLIFMGVIISSVLLNLYLYLQFIKIGTQIYLLEEKNNRLKLENQLLEKKILKTDNLNYLASQAAKLGFKYHLKTWIIEPKNFAYSY